EPHPTLLTRPCQAASVRARLCACTAGDRSPEPGVETVIDPVGHLEELQIVLDDQSEPADHGIQAGRLRGMELVIVNVRLVYYRGELAEGRVVEVVLQKNALE